MTLLQRYAIFSQSLVSQSVSVLHRGLLHRGISWHEFARTPRIYQNARSYKAVVMSTQRQWDQRQSFYKSVWSLLCKEVSINNNCSNRSVLFGLFPRMSVSKLSTASPFTANRKILQDTLVFSHSNDNFFKFVSLFGVVQMLMWGYLSLFSVQGLRSGPIAKQDTSNIPWWQKMLYAEGRYKNVISTICFIVGSSIFFITSIYPQRAVRNLWLLKGGKDVKITSYSWFGKTYTFKTPLEHISCLQSRTGSGNQVPFKIKNKSFFFLLDKQGRFHNPELFDFVIGLKRNLK